MKNLKNWKHLQNINIKDMHAAPPTILIGQDNSNLITSSKLVKGPPNAPVAAKTELGWVLSGNVPFFCGQRDNIEYNLFVSNEDAEDALHKLVKDYFSTESFGVKVTNEHVRSKNDIKAFEILNSTTKRESEDRFETGLLWKPELKELPDSKAVALKRLEYLERKIDKDPQLKNAYFNKIEYYVGKGYLRKLSTQEILQKNLEYDAAAKSHGFSLNNALLTKPDLFNSLPEIILKFRQRKVGFIADIKEMFHQVKIRNEDLSAQRILWRGENRNHEPDTYEMSVMIFWAVCSPCSAIFVKDTNAREFEKENPAVSKAIIERHYVDDYLDSKDTEEEALKMIEDIIEIHRRGGFQIYNWLCSSVKVLEKIPADMRANNVNDLNPETELPVERTLGLSWNCNFDSFSFNLKFNKIHLDIVTGKKRPTKREVLKLIMSIYDPLGFLSPIHVKGKIILQDTWKSGIGWDNDLPEDIFNRWLIWIEELKTVHKFVIPRCYTFESQTSIDKMQSIQLHIFCDASQQACAAVAYLRMETSEDKNFTTLVMSKTRVAPVKLLSIPRLELQAAVMASRIAKTVKSALEINIEQTYFWTDSRSVLSWIKSETKRFKSFVAHRVGEINEETETNQWKWVPTNENVADEATRKEKLCELNCASRWMKGPDFLRLQESFWPKEKDINTTQDEFTEENLIFVAVRKEENAYLPEFARFSSWMRLIRSTAWVIRFINLIQKKPIISATLNPEELAEAEKLWCKSVQCESFHEEISTLQNNKPLTSSSRLRQLSPFIDKDGVMRVKGRISLSENISEEVKHPVILDEKHPFTKLLIQWYHLKMKHQGQETVLNELRQKYWILNARSAVKLAWRECQFCKNERAKPLIPEMGLLPPQRLESHVKPFTYTGMDYFGPLEVTVKRSHEKRYGVIFTCMTTRAIHLEIAASLSTDSCIMAIRRFICRRGYPAEIFSDNGTNLRSAEKELKKAINELDITSITDNLSVKGIKWNFNPPAAPHMGGTWERLIRSVKTTLKVILKERYPKEDTLSTLFTEIEYIINSRPLTYVPLDAADSEALTPNHFLIGSSSSSWRVAQRLADHFWKRWLKEYLPTLQRRNKWFSSSEQIKVGDTVIVSDPALQRNCWPKGVIEKTFPGPDGKVRVVDVRTTTGLYRRPTTKVCVMNVASSPDNSC